jgi:hypothetical protein
MRTNATHLELEIRIGADSSSVLFIRLVCTVYTVSPESLYSSAQLPFYVDFPKGNPEMENP